MLEMKDFLVTILRRYDIEWADKKRKVTIDMYWIIEHHNLWVKFREIEKSS